MNEQNEQELARVFEEWMRRYLADPDGFMGLSDDPLTYGQGAARYFLKLWEELA